LINGAPVIILIRVIKVFGMSHAFWEQKKLEQMNDKEWELLCDGCARCCLLKLEDEESGELYFTRVSCHLLDTQTCRCKDYENRLAKVSECLQIKNMSLSEYQWLPESCAYRLLSEGRPLAYWHPLISGDPNSVKAAGVTVSGFAISEEYVHPDQLQDQLISLSANVSSLED
jgi:uncharacterized cysteine cluster protein YcgN (CxxCxxCC family)